MNITKAQTIALVVYGNFYLRGNKLEGFYPENPVFAACKEISFIWPSCSNSRPEDWFQQLKNDGVTALKLVFFRSDNLNERATANHIGGGLRWMIKTYGAKGSYYWEATWQLSGNSGEYIVNYHCIGLADYSRRLEITEDVARSNLRHSLQNMRDFLFSAQPRDAANFVKTMPALVDCRNRLDAAIKLMDGKINTSDYIRYWLYPLNFLPMHTEILLDAAQLGDIFGLPEWMGEALYDEYADYNEIANQLYIDTTFATEIAASASAESKEPLTGLMDLGEIEVEVSRLAALIGVEGHKSLPTYGYTRDAGYPHLEVDERGYHFVRVERNKEVMRLTSANLDDILYEVFSSVTWRMAGDYELANRIKNQDFRRLLFSKHEELLSLVSAEWGQRLAAHYQEVLSQYPFDDDI